MDDSISELAKYAKAILSTQLQMLTPREDQEKPEVFLARVGLTARQIAEITGKSEAAISKAVERARKKGK